MLEPFAGARWWKFDFHTHTPASLDMPWSRIENEEERLSPEQWLLRFMAAQIDCVAVTDHNTSDWIDSLKNAYSRLESDRPAGSGRSVSFPGWSCRSTAVSIFSPSSIATRRSATSVTCSRGWITGERPVVATASRASPRWRLSKSLPTSARWRYPHTSIGRMDSCRSPGTPAGLRWMRTPCVR